MEVEAEASGEMYVSGLLCNIFLNLAKSQALMERAQEKFEKKSEGEVILPTAQIGYLSRIVTQYCSILDKIVTGKTS